jgi:hypothetical protein
MTRPFKTKILLDGGDASETRRIMQLLGFLDGQKTNPSLIGRFAGYLPPSPFAMRARGQAQARPRG